MRWLTLAFSVIFRTLPDLEVPRFKGSSVCTKLSLSESSLYRTVLLPSFLVLIRGGRLNLPPNTFSPNCPPKRFSNSSSASRARLALVAPREAPRPPRPLLPPRPPPRPLPQPLPPLPPLPPLLHLPHRPHLPLLPVPRPCQFRLPAVSFRLIFRLGFLDCTTLL